MVTQKKRTRRNKIGLPPGTLLPAENTKREKPSLLIFDYNESDVFNQTIEKDFDPNQLLDETTVTWLNVNGVHDVEILEQIGSTLGIHPLVLEDIQNTDQRPKVDDYRTYFYLTMKMLRWDDEKAAAKKEQVSLIVGKTFVISFQEYQGDVFDTIRQRILNGTGRVRKEIAPYLAYALLDAMVDNYFLVLEELEDRFDKLEETVLFTLNTDIMLSLHHLKSQVGLVRRNIWPLREILSTIQKEEIALIPEHIRIFFGDVFDHTLHLMDSVEVLREIGVSLVELHTSKQSNTMNSVMKVLTIIATIFIPLTFIAGIYGMNFSHMPELQVRWAYPVVLGIMGGVGLTMLIFFKKRKWL